MDHVINVEGEAPVDLESGRINGDEVASTKTNTSVSPSSGESAVETFSTKFCYGEHLVQLSVQFSNGNEGSPKKSVQFSKGNEGSPKNAKLDNEKSGSFGEKRAKKEKRKSIGARKPPRPPRAPRGLSLDAADQKLIKEIAEAAIMKRARIERMKTLKKMKATKSSSSSNKSLFALLFTVLFCIVIIFEGISSVNSARSFSRTSGTAQATGRIRLISANLNPSVADPSFARSLRSEEHNLGLDPTSKAKTLNSQSP